MKYKYFLAPSLFIIILAVASCKKFVDIEPAPDLVATEKIFTSEATAIAAINGVYVQMRETAPSLSNGTLSIYASLNADELKTSSTNLEYDIFESNTIPAVSEVITYQLWHPAYLLIYRANSLLEKLQASTALSPAVKNQLIGEMKTVRSLVYFYLVNLFGDVPLVIASDYRVNEAKPRDATNNIYQQIITDLIAAADLLTNTYPSAGKARPNKYTALALLARVYLYHKDWADTERIATSVIEQGNYTLSNSLDNIFTTNSSETIWEILSPAESSNTAEGGNFIPASATDIPTFYLTDQLLNAFETGDKRKINWLGKNEVNGIIYYYPYKYKARDNNPVTENLITFRLAEQYLVRAEARAMQNNLAGALEDLNVIRNRAGLPNTTATTQTSILEAIFKERQVELFTEWGHRWLDLKRTSRADTILQPLKGANWQPTDQLYPIPFSEMQINSFLVQNPGY